MMSDTIESKPVVDTYKEHYKHKHFFHKDCSTCFTANKGKKEYPTYHSNESYKALDQIERFSNPIRD